MKKILSLFLLPLLLSACMGERKNHPLELHRLDSTLAEGGVPPDSAMAAAASKLFEISGYGVLTDSSIALYSQKRIIAMSRGRMDSVWGTAAEPSPRFRSLEKSLGALKASLEQQFPALSMPEIFTVISPFNQSVFTVDSTMFLGLNHYLGADYDLYGYFPDYIRERKEPERILPDVAEALIRRDYPFEPTSEYPTVVSRLIYEGAVVEAVSQLTGLSPQEVLGYNEQEWKWLEDNEKEMWGALASRKLLFSTDEMTASMLTGLAPATNILNVDSPGYAGRFVGHRIVRSFLKNNDLTLSELLLPSFYDDPQTLSKSAYVP